MFHGFQADFTPGDFQAPHGFADLITQSRDDFPADIRRLVPHLLFHRAQVFLHPPFRCRAPLHVWGSLSGLPDFNSFKAFVNIGQ